MSESEPSPKRQRKEESPAETEESSTTEEVVVKKYGDKELSDVCLVVGNTEFHVHKMTLALQSKRFKALFYGHFKETDQQSRIEIDADPVAFGKMLDVIYDWRFKNTSFFNCGVKTTNSSKVFWEQAGNLFVLLERFDVHRARKLFVKNINKNWCQPEDGMAKCPFCVNYYAFCIIYGIKISISYSFPPSVLKEWVERYYEGVPLAHERSLFQKIMLNMAT